MILKEAIPHSSRVQRRVNGGRVWQNPLSKTSRLEKDRVKWEDLPAFTKEFDWLLSSSSNDFFEQIEVQSQDLCEGNQVLTEVKIFKDWTFVVHVNNRKVAKETVCVFELGASNYFRSCTKLLYYIISVTICCSAHRTKVLSRSCKFPSPKMNLNAFLCRFPTAFGKYITILDQVRKIRRFRSISFEFQGFENRPRICFLPFRILYCKPVL